MATLAEQVQRLRLGLDLFKGFRSSTALALGLMAVIVMMLVPIPAWMLDLGLVTSFGLAALVFTIVLFIERPLDFSSFPTILLASLILRLSLNISSTKLIIGNGHTGTAAAGHVIEGVAEFVMGGDPFLGFVIFFILLIVNFVVVTKGAARMAEVGARFALDGMPGRQLAIDADVSSGAITHEEAKRRRETEQAEATFFGSLDGVSKFVKGDAVAGLLITLLNFVVGLAIGVMAHGMSLSDALRTYTVLTVGDGLVTQLPAVIISVASALLLSRGGMDHTTEIALTQQIGRFPAAIFTVAALMLVFAAMPGFPTIPFLLAAVGLAFVALRAGEHARDREVAAVAREEAEVTKASPTTMGDLIDLDDIHIEFAPDLIAMALDPGTGLDARIEGMRRYVAQTYGLILPEVRLTDQPQLEAGAYRIRIQGVAVAEERLYPNRVMVLAGEDPSDLPPGQDVREPVYGAPARWVDPSEQDDLTLSGHTVVGAAEVLATHLLEIVRDNLSKLLTLRSLNRLLDELVRLTDKRRAEANKRLLDDLIPDKVPVDMALMVLRLLLDERVSIRNLPLILEAIAEARPSYGRPEAICEYVRQRLGFQIVAELRRADGRLPLIQLAPEWERRFQQYQISGEGGGVEVALPPEEFNRLAQAIAVTLREATPSGGEPALVTSAKRRRFVKTVAAARGLGLPVLSFEEIGTQVRPAILGVVAG